MQSLAQLEEQENIRKDGENLRTYQKEIMAGFISNLDSLFAECLNEYLDSESDARVVKGIRYAFEFMKKINGGTDADR